MASPEFPNFRLDGRRALVTGAGRGIGRAVAMTLAEAGAEVHLVARSREQIEAVAAEIGTLGGTAKALALDVTNRAETDAAIAENGPYHVLFNNAGSARRAEVLDMSEENFDFVFDLNVRAAYFVARAVAKGLVDSGQPGSIINVSSQMGHVGGVGRSVYCATKFAVEGFSKCMALEWAPHNIRVNTICPTFIETPLTEGVLQDPDFRQFVLDRIPLNRIGETRDITGAALFLASDASSLMTGSALMVDGGWTAI